MLQAALRDWREDKGKGGETATALLLQRIDRALDSIIARESARVEDGLGSLAIVATSSPFIGLFGTVWGIMTAFRSIAAARNTSLAVVAPGIAEALFATAIGLFAAIPALIAYNKFQGDVAKKQARLEGFADEFSAILSRQIDQHTVHDRAA
jgi:biopolymer transport protein TolQ